MPATPQDRLYGLTTSVAVKPPVFISADYHITCFGEQTITSKTPTDERTITTTEGMRILLLGQDNPVENGIWVARRSFWVRAPDFNGARDAVNGTLVFSITGDCWQVEAVDPVVIGLSAIHFRPTYPFEANLDIFQRTLRVPEASVSVLPSAADRAWKGLGFDGAGQPKLQDPAGTGLWGYVPAIGSFEKGSIITERFQVLLWESTNEYWRWDGSPFPPKIVLPGSTPDTAGGRGKGKWLDVTDATLRSNLGSGEEGLGDNLIMRKLGGSVNAALRYVSVDGFGPDLTGETDSTLAVLKAAAVAKTLADSAYRTGDTTYYVVKFGFGIYMLGDVPLYSGISYEGQGAGTLIRPLPVASYCFTTVGTEKYDPANLKRMFYPAVSNLYIGCGYFEPLFDIPENVGGINIKYASYLWLDNIGIRHLDGCGMNLSEVWDSDFDNIRIMYCGNTRNTSNIKYGLDINAGDNTVDGSNALRFTGLHIETCPALLNIGERSRHLSFICPKLEAQEADAYPSKIKNSRGISFVSPELTWGRSDEFMFDMTGDNQLISFASPVIISSLSKIGNYFLYDSTLGALSINNPQMRGVRQLANGSNIKVSGGTAELSGPVLIDGTSNVTVENVDWRHLTQPAGGSTAPAIQVNGPGCKITGNKLHFAGAANDGFVGVYVGPLAVDAQATDNLFSGARSTALSIAAAAVPGAMLYGNRVVDGGAFTTLVSGSKPAFPLLYTGTPPQKYPVDFPGAVTLAPNAAYMFSGLTTASQLLIAASWTFSSALYSESAMVLMNNSSGNVHVINSLRGMILDGSAGMPGAYIYITKSGSNYTVTNKYTETVTIKIAAVNL